MADLFHWWGSDLALGPSGDLLAVEGLERDDQRIVRRLCTAGRKTGAGIAEYLFQPDYGGSAPWYVGRPVDALVIEGHVRAQMYGETAVSHAPEPVIAATQSADGLLAVDIRYTDDAMGSARTLSFELAR